MFLERTPFRKNYLSIDIGVPQNGWFIMENPIQMDDLGVPLFLETRIYIYIYLYIYIW